MVDMTLVTHSLLLFFVLFGSLLWVTEHAHPVVGNHKVVITETLLSSANDPWS